MFDLARLTPRSVRWCGALLLALGAALPSTAQVRLGGDVPDLSAAAQAARAASSARRALDGVALEGPLDPATYLVGPGDVFTVSIGGSVPRQTDAVVSADGTLVVPEAGSFDVGGRPLGSVQSTVGAALSRRYQNVPTDVTLATLRQFYVHVSGAVPLPGRQLVSAVARVSDALELASGGVSVQALAEYDRLATPTTSERDAAETLRQQQLSAPLANATVQQRALAERGDVWPDVRRLPALRNVRVRHLDGTETRVDLLRYFGAGDLAANPTLHDGDAIYLPTFDPTREGASVAGAVDRPGLYDVRPGDTVRDLLVAATGEDGLDRIQSVRLTRADGAGAPVEAALADARALAVAPRDQVFAVEMDPEAGIAEVVGAVRFPGLYPITSGETTLEELVGRAGGLRFDALPRGAYLERRATSLPAALDGDASTLSDLDLFSRQFIASELARTPRQPVDLTGGGPTPPVPLIDGDRLVVPRDLGGVRVFGQVGQPGFVPYTPGRTAAAYVEAVGGTGPSATETYVVEAGSGRLVPGADTEVREGDAVFVDREPTAEDPTLAQLTLQERADARQDRQETRQARYQLAQTVVAAVAAVASVILAVAALPN